jgi:hypothetical protein
MQIRQLSSRDGNALVALRGLGLSKAAYRRSENLAVRLRS